MQHDSPPRFTDQSPESKIVASLEKISQAFRVLLWHESKEHSLSPLQVQVLNFLLRHGASNRKVSALAGEFDMTKATISDTVKTLEQKKLISKKWDERDTRSYVIHLTPKGRQVAQNTEAFTQEIRRPIEGLSEGEKENLLLSLMDIIRHLNKSGVITVQRMCKTCVHYESTAAGDQHFCKLLNQPLHVTELRVDCPEHTPIPR